MENEKQMQWTQRNTKYLESSRYGVAEFSRPHIFNQLSICAGDLATHSERIFSIQFVFPPILSHVLSQLGNIAHTLNDTTELDKSIAVINNVLKLINVQNVYLNWEKTTALLVMININIFV